MKTFNYLCMLICNFLLPHQIWQEALVSAISDNTMLHASLMVLCFTEVQLWPIEVLRCQNRDFLLFCFCDLDLNRMTFIYEGHIWLDYLTSLKAWLLQQSVVWRLWSAAVEATDGTERCGACRDTDKKVWPHHASVTPVSYTHLTLPTIYSV